jgi:AcrR family transcriptional regulator
LPRPSVQLLSPEKIVAAALAIIDADGMEALSMRRLAAELGVQGPSLYHHFAGKKEMLGAIVDQIYSEIDLDRVDGTWEQALTSYSKQLRAVLMAHPHAVESVAMTPVTTDAGLRIYEHMIERLMACGWELEFSRQVTLVVENLVFGAVFTANVPAIELSEGQEPQYPRLTELVHGPPVPQPDDGYEIGFAALIEGLRVITARS